MSKLPKAQIGRIASVVNQDIILALIACMAFLGLCSQVRDCFVGEDRARAKCIIAGGDELKCCKEFSSVSGSCWHLEKESK